jgi:hypothetical protein
MRETFEGADYRVRRGESGRVWAFLRPTDSCLFWGTGVGMAGEFGLMLMMPR